MALRFRHLGVSLLALALTTTTLHAQQEEPKTPLGKKMAALNTAFRALGRQIEDPSKNASSLELIETIETNAKGVLTLEPEKKEKVPAAEQAKFMADYKAGIEKLVATTGELKAAVKAGKNAEAVAIIDKMKGLQRESHAEFRIRKAGPPGGQY